MPVYIVIFSIIGFSGYMLTAGALLTAGPLWCNLLGAAMVVGMVAFATHLYRLVAEGRRCRRLQELKRRMMPGPFAAGYDR